jgi:alpha-mannosidase
MLPTPEAQCLGSYHYHYALLPYAGHWQEARVWRSAQGYAAQPWVFVTKEHSGGLPKRFGYISLLPESLILSAVKKAEFGTAIIVRAYNTTSSPVEGEITFGKTPTSVRLVDLKEAPLEGEGVVAQGDKVKLNFGPYQIRTLEVAFAELEEELDW